MAAELPPHRPSINHTFTLEIDENGQKKNPSWGPLYKITRNELLILRNTLNELLNKGFIHTNNSAARTPILFAKKKGAFDFI